MTAKNTISTIDAYIATFPADVQLILQKMRQTIHETAPGAEEAINYGIPTFKLNGNLVHFAAYKRHIGFYPTHPLRHRGLYRGIVTLRGF